MGKTTLLKALMGFLPATGGRVLFGRDDVTAAEPYRRARLGLGYVPQGREIFPGLTAYDNLRMGCGKQPGAEQGIIATVLEQFPRLTPSWTRALSENLTALQPSARSTGDDQRETTPWQSGDPRSSSCAASPKTSACTWARRSSNPTTR